MRNCVWIRISIHQTQPFCWAGPPAQLVCTVAGEMGGECGENKSQTFTRRENSPYPPSLSFPNPPLSLSALSTWYSYVMVAQKTLHTCERIGDCCQTNALIRQNYNITLHIRTNFLVTI